MNQLEVCRKWHGKTQFLAFCLKNHFSHVQDHLLSFLQCILVPFSDTSLNQYVHFWGFQVKAKIQQTSPKKVSIFLLCKAFSGWNSATKIYPSQLWIQNLDFFVKFSPFVKVKFSPKILALIIQGFQRPGIQSHLIFVASTELGSRKSNWKSAEHQAVWRPQHEVFFFFVVLFCLWSTPSQMGFR